MGSKVWFQSLLILPAAQGAAYADGPWWISLGILTGADGINEGSLHQQQQCIPFIVINKPPNG